MCCQTKKPILLSTGASNIKEITKAVNYLKKNGSTQIALMHCILNYPTLDNDANLGMIADLKKKFPKYKIGYSDHTKPDEKLSNLYAATLLGAEIIEKHFTDNKMKVGNDHYHSMDFKNLKNFKDSLEKLRNIYGDDNINYLISEKKSIKFARRAIYTTRKFRKGKIKALIDIISKRPLANGMCASNFYKIIGKKINLNLTEDKIIKKVI